MNDSANLFGKPVRFREYHVKMEELEEMRYKVDILADECLIALQERGETIDTFISYFTTQEPARYEDPRINNFIKSIEIEPEW
jgi:chorismate mutase